MAELMLRLVKDGKIVGYYLLCSYRRAQEIGLNIHWDAKITRKSSDATQLFWKREGNVWWGCEPMRPPTNDTLELGIKHGDEWWFSGDLIQSNGKVATLKYDDKWGEFFLEYPEENCLPFWYARDLGMVDCRVGNTHEERKP